MNTTEVWAGDFGNDYVERNRIQWQKRERFWRSIVPDDVKTVLEVGCNIGSNLKAIRGAVGIDGVGVDVNEKALLEAAGAGFEVHRMPGSEISQRLGHEAYDFVFTAGVLIHVPPESLDQTMAAIVEASKKYVLAVEYAHPEDTMIEYRGQTGLLWKRPYGQLYQKMGLKLIAFGMASHEDGFDSCAYWLMEKQ
jgi:pseudaminic acid biosynthesis-associated methylase